ncbi:hypothetical protein KFK09_014985 [Dendrobium nobile]|uniref:Endonuclease/exonuclease/phosphatase domain-containing protein n=1 Tax=Dendrobium nobile TaxID=94219 RepID=A0A8T3B4L8_DENNO|nr:hypothetical protein KFK09_014985 [Dendrobium nobile]
MGKRNGIKRLVRKRVRMVKTQLRLLLDLPELKLRQKMVMIKALMWNVRGIGGKDSKNRVKNLCRIHNIKLLILSEPMINADKIVETARFLGYNSSFANCSNKLWLFWHNTITIDIIADHHQVVHCHINVFNTNCFASFVYAASTRLSRLNLWEQLCSFSVNISGPWCVGGDFNIISNATERRGGSRPNIKAMEDFNDMINDCNLNDIGFLGNSFTWSRANLYQRLDRFLFNNDWLSFFSSTNVEHLSKTLSDHAPLLLTINVVNQRGTSAFRFFNMWLMHDSFKKVVENNWNAPVFPDNNISGMLRLWSKLTRLKQCLRYWNKFVFKNVFSNIIDAESRVVVLEGNFLNNPSEENTIILNNAKNELCLLHLQEEAFWKQKANVKFAIEGDRNTKFYHAIANKNKNRSKIHKIINSDGNVLEKDEDIVKSGVDFFANMFVKHSNTIPIPDNFIIPNLISEEDNNMLCQFPSDIEICDVIKDMNAEATAGPDGFTTKFFQSSWELVKEDVLHAVVDFFGGNPYPKFFSSANIVLIPKRDGANTWTDFRPISLCTFFNKLNSKILANRLSKILPKIISLNQTGFVKGRSISDNVLLA